MSDGLTDARNAALAAELRFRMLNSIILCLEDWDNEAKFAIAVDLIYSHGEMLVENPDKANSEFLTRLHGHDYDAWIKLMAFTLRQGDNISQSMLKQLKDLSPFGDKIMLLADFDGQRIHLSATNDFTNRLIRHLDGRCGSDPERYPRLILLDCRVAGAVPIRR